ncbi:unnamed protein product [Ilex paraguariensis]|uniref:Uncharacterized protein n=1 Tax=Ilex paraguariensis TaxID=185542 RepID=A0ABC8TKG2_9AQUA
MEKKGQKKRKGGQRERKIPRSSRSVMYKVQPAMNRFHEIRWLMRERERDRERRWMLFAQKRDGGRVFAEKRFEMDGFWHGFWKGTRHLTKKREPLLVQGFGEVTA